MNIFKPKIKIEINNPIFQENLNQITNLIIKLKLLNPENKGQGLNSTI
jgi:hypothetical protein